LFSTDRLAVARPVIRVAFEGGGPVGEVTRVKMLLAGGAIAQAPFESTLKQQALA